MNLFLNQSMRVEFKFEKIYVILLNHILIMLNVNQY